MGGRPGWPRAARGLIAARHRPRPDHPRVSRRIDLLGVDELAEGEMRMVWVDQTDPVLVVHVNGEFQALQGTCSHEYFELDRGFLTAGTLTCALHLSRFDLADGEALDPPGGAAARGLPGGGRGRPGDDRGARTGPLEVNEEA